ncbi:MAG: DGQHR domain-containing protein [Rikenellaceae bacterium]|nr:DGQHR domain-containing protein [Rikenellaceae bacterium]
MDKIKVNCLEAQQPIGPMYIAVIDHKNLINISYADVRRLELGNENREIEDYIGIQRELVPAREKEIGRYVNLIDATFPNSIILSIESKYVEYDEKNKILLIDNDKNVAKVLDGQHRIAGLKHFDQEELKFECIVTIYIDMELEDQAIVFSTINKEQKKVSNSLVADLFAFAQSKSPQKTCHNIARALNKNENSPFFKKIKILENARDKENESLTQDTFVKSLMKYISSDPQQDRDFYKRHKDRKHSKLPHTTGVEEKRLFLRNIFIDDDTDVKIAQILWNYFYAVKNKWPEAWGVVRDNNVLNKSTGFIALMRFFKDVYLYINKEVPTKEEFEKIFQQIEIADNTFTKENYIPGSSGQSALYNILKKQSIDRRA